MRVLLKQFCEGLTSVSICTYIMSGIVRVRRGGAGAIGQLSFADQLIVN